MADLFEIHWTEVAGRDLAQILEYLAREASVDRALCTYEEVRARVATLKAFPRRCRVVPELREIGLTEFRETILPPYRVLFRIDGVRLDILGVLDSRRDLDELLIERALER